jgi:hypothetical protein
VSLAPSAADFEHHGPTSRDVAERVSILRHYRLRLFGPLGAG